MSEWDKVGEDGKLKDGDYLLTDGRAWVEAGPYALRIIRTNNGISVYLYENGHEDEDPITEMHAEDVVMPEDVCPACGGSHNEREEY